MQEYLEGGIKLVWVVYPWTHSVAVHFPDQKSIRYTSGAVFDGAGVIPGVQIAVDDIFRLP